ncbi:3-oxoacyl-ACP reductase family protein [Vibrio spartinae]|uniref:3-oxoacyl-[acyl-carrier-protein] reductase FabG n=1 Tax=Vibrio spartinae TaxID=1918945 RepID=A0ABX6QV67_9VIBR|nr:3-oxoacyl-ACP reductase family protein [Vibrio spartinae]QMV13116.1 3-oxoacyl-[acyl-carrier-protein] reductase FabG [Vibrio spartinae]
MTEQTSNRTALVTGASRGIGRGVALGLAAKGYDVAFCYRRDENLANQLASDISQYGVNALPIQADVAECQDIESMFNQINYRFGRLDVLVNNAGITRDGLLATMSDDDMWDVIRTNLIGTMMCSRAAVKMMMMQRHGCIINISSISATKPNKGQSNYAATKGGVESFTRALAVEVARKNIRVNCIAPGVIQTEMVGELLADSGDLIRKKLLAKRLGNPEDISKAVLYLADPENDFLTGEILSVNGGMALL